MPKTIYMMRKTPVLFPFYNIFFKKNSFPLRSTPQKLPLLIQHPYPNYPFSMKSAFLQAKSKKSHLPRPKTPAAPIQMLSNNLLP